MSTIHKIISVYSVKFLNVHKVFSDMCAYNSTRCEVYKILNANGVETPRYEICNRDDDTDGGKLDWEARKDFGEELEGVWLTLGWLGFRERVWLMFEYSSCLLLVQAFYQKYWVNLTQMQTQQIFLTTAKESLKCKFFSLSGLRYL